MFFLYGSYVLFFTRMCFSCFSVLFSVKSRCYMTFLRKSVL